MRNGRRVQLFHFINCLNRDGLGREINFSLPDERVTRLLEHTIEWRSLHRRKKAIVLMYRVLTLPLG